MPRAGRKSIPYGRRLVVCAGAVGLVLGAAQAQDRSLAARIRNDDPAEYLHKPMYGENSAVWKDLDRQGFAISKELWERLRQVGAARLPGVALAELAQYGVASMRYRVAVIAAHVNTDRVLQKTDRLIPDNGLYGSVTAFIGRDGRRGLAVDASAYRPKYPDKLDEARFFFVGPDRRETPAAVEPVTGLPGLFLVTPDMLATDAAKSAGRVRVTLAGRPIFDTALDGDLANREGFYQAYEAAIAKYQALLPPPVQQIAAVIGTYGEPTPEDMADALVKNKETASGILMGFMFDPVRAKRCGFEKIEGLKTSEGLAILRKCLKVEKGKCVPSSRGYICEFVMILGIDGWEERQSPGKGRFFKDETGWVVSGS